MICFIIILIMFNIYKEKRGLTLKTGEAKANNFIDQSNLNRCWP